MDRQTEFIAKVDYKWVLPKKKNYFKNIFKLIVFNFSWKRQLLKKQDDAKFTNETISILINNILPSHVGE